MQGELINEIKFNQIENIDWEDITIDSKYIYISDSGNNYDTRKNLKILKFSLIDYKFIGEINFSYPEQLEYKYNKESQFDAEGIISVNNNLMLFTKNRKKLNTQVYILPKDLGTFKANLIGEIDTNLIITGSDYDDISKTLVLSGTKDFKDYSILVYPDVSFNPLRVSEKKEIKIKLDKMQVEGVKFFSPNTIWLTSENENKLSRPKLIKIRF